MTLNILLNFSLISICRTVRLPAVMKAITAVTIPKVPEFPVDEAGLQKRLKQLAQVKEEDIKTTKVSKEMTS